MSSRRRNVFATLAILCVALPTLVLQASAAAIGIHPPSPRSTRVQRSPTATWYHRSDHPAHALFRREGLHARQSPPEVGSPEWRAAYPASTPPASSAPTAWVNALNQALQDGSIPNAPVATLTGAGPQYPGGRRPSDPDICAAASFSCRVPGDIWDGPTGMIGLNFDDGPLPASPRLYQFLEQHNETATHFFIGTNILNNPQIFLQALEVSQDIAIHTWTHPHMTTLSNMDVLLQLGWTMQIIYDSSGKLPRFWRPPYGETDARVSGIAREVFGLTTVMWNQDTDDWDIGLPGGPTLTSIQNNFNRWLTGPKTPGLIVLEHELSDDTITAFINAYPGFAANGWETGSIADMFPDDDGAYQDGDPAFGTLSANNAVPTIPGLSGITSPTPTPTAPSNTTTAAPTSTGTNDAAAAQSSSAALSGKRLDIGMWHAPVVMVGALVFGLLVPFL